MASRTCMVTTAGGLALNAAQALSCGRDDHDIEGHHKRGESQVPGMAWACGGRAHVSCPCVSHSLLSLRWLPEAMREKMIKTSNRRHERLLAGC